MKHRPEETLSIDDSTTRCRFELGGNRILFMQDHSLPKLMEREARIPSWKARKGICSFRAFILSSFRDASWRPRTTDSVAGPPRPHSDRQPFERPRQR